MIQNCKYCAKPFVNRERLSKHVHDAHYFMCQNCEKWFPRGTRRRMIGEFAFCSPCYRKESR